MTSLPAVNDTAISDIMKLSWYDGFKAAAETAASLRMSPGEDLLGPGRDSVVSLLESLLAKYQRELPVEPEIMRENRERIAISFRSRRISGLGS